MEKQLFYSEGVSICYSRLNSGVEPLVLLYCLIGVAYRDISSTN